MMNRILRRESGVYIVFLAFAVVALISLCAIVLAGGFLSGNKTRLDNAVNLAALGAIEAYVRAPLELNYEQRAGAALNKANYILGEHGLIGGGEIGALGFEGQLLFDGRYLEFGVWYPEDDGSGPCGPDPYPCYRPAACQPYPSPPGCGPNVNAVKVVAKTTQPFALPLGFFLGRDRLDIQSQSMAAVVQRCTSLLLDVSPSTIFSSHAQLKDFDPTTFDKGKWYPEAGHSPPQTLPVQLECDEAVVECNEGPPNFCACPRNASWFAFTWDTALRYFNPGTGSFFHVDPESDASYEPGGVAPCRHIGGAIYGPPCQSPGCENEGKLWCFLAYNDNEFQDRSKDYRFVESRYGRLLVDAETRPQPLSDFLLGFNSASRLLENQASFSDKLQVKIFKGDVFDRIPVPPSGVPSPDSLFTRELGYITQLTNVDNIKKGEEVIYPNFVSRGWFPRYIESTSTSTGITDIPGSNIIKALEEAIDSLADTEQCPANAKKSIIIATDGVMICEPGTTNCNVDWSIYLNSEQYLLEEGNSLLRRLQDARIAVTVLFAGEGIGANFRNVRLEKEPGQFYYPDYFEMQARGMGGLPEGGIGGDWSELSDSSIVDYRSCCSTPVCDCRVQPCSCGLTDEEAFYKLGQPGYFFRRVNGVFAELALKTGGIFCPLLPRGEEEWYEASEPRVMKFDHRENVIGPGNRLEYAPEYLEEGAYAAKCAQLTLGLNPFILVEPER